MSYEKTVPGPLNQEVKPYGFTGDSKMTCIRHFEGQILGIPGMGLDLRGWCHHAVTLASSLRGLYTLPTTGANSLFTCPFLCFSIF